MWARPHPLDPDVEAIHSVLLYRPVGLRELELIAETGFSAFPPRPEHQPIFYPVLSFDYAEQIARDWNTKDAASGFCGFVTKFKVEDSFAQRFEIHTVGSSAHQELWVPAEQLNQFNSKIQGPIAIVAHYYGEQFEHPLDPESDLPTQLANQPSARQDSDG